jgi:hypothetical protein
MGNQARQQIEIRLVNGGMHIKATLAVKYELE